MHSRVYKLYDKQWPHAEYIAKPQIIKQYLLRCANREPTEEIIRYLA